MEQGLITEQQDDILYKHTVRPNWGLAVLAYEDGDKRAFQFEDGKLRVFKQGYFKYLQPVDTAVDHSARTLARLGSRTAATAKTGSSVKKRDALPLDAQIMHFVDVYADGFAGAKWQKAKRGADAKRRLKRHRDPAISEAQSFLGRESMTRLMQEGKHAEVLTGLVALLGGTNLVSKKKLEPMATVYEERAIPLVHALHALLHEEDGAMTLRFERWYTELERVCQGSPGWSLTTAPLALTQPEHHVCVRPATFRRQAAWMAPRLAKERAVTGRIYERWLSMTRGIGELLTRADLRVRDNLDIYDFMVDTLSPKNMERARELYRERQ